MPILIDSAFDNFVKTRIHEVLLQMNQSSAATCVQFRERQNEENYLNFKMSPVQQMCYSEYVGFVNSGEQIIYLSKECAHPRFLYWTILQALGLPAEHMRPDRDQYIEINWANIDLSFPNVLMGFKKYEWIDQRLENFPYDYRSRLHYTNNIFTKDLTKETVRARDDPKRQLGNPLRPTREDMRKVAALYCSVPPSDGPIVLDPKPAIKIPPPGVVAGAAPGLNSPDSLCQCFDNPIGGSCYDENAFEWKHMSAQCLGPDPTNPVCRCQFHFNANVFFHRFFSCISFYYYFQPCYCTPEAVNGIMTCQKYCYQNTTEF